MIDDDATSRGASQPGYLSAAGSPLLRPREFYRETVEAFKISARIAPRLTVRSMRSRFRSSFLGYFWLVGPGLAVSGTWLYLTWSGVIDGGDTRLPYAVFVIAGILLWTSFVDAVNSPLSELLAAANLLNKVNFPPEAVLLSGFLGVVINCAVRLLVLIPVFLLSGVRPGWSLVLAPLGVLTLLLFGFSVGLLVAPIGALFQDVGQAIPVATYFAFFLTPVAYSIKPSDPGGKILHYNPATPVLSSARDWLTGGPLEVSIGWWIMLGATLLMTAFGWVVFRVAMPHLVDRITA